MNTRGILFSSLSILCVNMIAATDTTLLAQPSLVRSMTTHPHLVNPDFERGKIGDMPEGWDFRTPDGYAAELTTARPRSGRRSVLLQSTPHGDRESGAGFGNIMQMIDAEAFRGRRVRFRGAVRVEPGSRAQLWMRVDLDGERTGFFDNMENRPVLSDEWTHYDIVGDVDDEAAVVNIGMILIGEGKAWLDDVSLEDLGRFVTPAEPARPLSQTGLENLVAFTRLLGYVRHFHPSDEAASADWDALAVTGVREVESARNPRELAARLERIFQPVAPTLRIFSTGDRSISSYHIAPPQPAPSSLKIISWRHRGYRLVESENSPYLSSRVTVDAPGGRIPANAPDPRTPFIADLGAGVTAVLPTALFADARGTLPRARSQAGRPADSLVRYSGNDRATRLGDVALAWNIMQHFYPYFDHARSDWREALRQALASAATDMSEQSFLLTLRSMIARLEDGHGGVYHSSVDMTYMLPVLLGWVEGQLVVTEVAEGGADGLQPGDIVLSVDGRPAVEVLERMEGLISGATPQWRRHVSLRNLLRGGKDSEIGLEVQSRTGVRRAVTLRRTIQTKSLVERRPPMIHQLRPGVMYVDLDRISDEDFQAALPRLDSARGIIFDLRGYPKVSPVVISHLITSPVMSSRWLVPVVTAPDRQGVAEYDSSRWPVEPKAPHLKAKVAFLTDGRAISYAETFMGIIEAYRIAEIVGEPTAGTNGNINPFTLPGDYTVVWTGMKVLKHDDSPIHGVGIRPTVPVSRTLRGVVEGRDEQLEKAIEIVSGKDEG